MRIWTLDSGVRNGLVTGHTNSILNISRMNIKNIVTFSTDKTMRLWDIEKNFVCTNTFTVASPYTDYGGRAGVHRPE